MSARPTGARAARWRQGIEGVVKTGAGEFNVFCSLAFILFCDNSLMLAFRKNKKKTLDKKQPHLKIKKGVAQKKHVPDWKHRANHMN